MSSGLNVHSMGSLEKMEKVVMSYQKLSEEQQGQVDCSGIVRT